jgi:hypothetical protein
MAPDAVEVVTATGAKSGHIRDYDECPVGCFAGLITGRRSRTLDAWKWASVCEMRAIATVALPRHVTDKIT